MRFTLPVPWWGLALLAAGAVALAIATYRRAFLTPRRRSLLTALRTSSTGLVIVCLLGPVVRSRPAARSTGTVAVLIDRSRSMALEDRQKISRLDRADTIVRGTLVPALSKTWPVQTLLFGDGVRDARDVTLAPTADRSDLAGALRATAARFNSRGLAGIVVVTDGARTDREDLGELGRQLGVPVVAIGVGSDDAPDLAVRSLAASQSRLDLSLVDLTVNVEARGLDRPFDLRLLQNGRVIDRRTLTPGQGALVADFTVAPDRDAPTTFTADIPADPAELTAGNNQRSILVPSPGRRRRLLVLEGAPGFEHAFLTRAWSEDTSLDVDSVVRKGRDEHGEDTFFVQAAGLRAESLAAGFPATRQALFAYDAVILANQDVRLLSQEQLGWLREFVGSRGGGLLLLGARSFDNQALAGSPIDELLPLRPTEGGGIVPAASLTGGTSERVRLTSEGAHHPMMRIGTTDEEGLKRWAALPALAGHVKLGPPRPGASILAVTEGRSGDEALVAVQRYGAGRTMMFGGEASWRWKMMLPSGDRSYDRFWRQAARWLSGDAPDPVTLDPIPAVEEGGDAPIALVVRDADYKPAPDASVSVRIERPDGASEQLTPTLVDAAAARFATTVPSAGAGISRVHVEAAKGSASLGTADAPFLSGAFDRELADPRLDAGTLRLLAEASGGAYLTPEHAAEAARFLQNRPAMLRPEEWRDWWQTPWMLLLVVALLSAEWTLRRQWGLK